MLLFKIQLLYETDSIHKYCFHMYIEPKGEHIYKNYLPIYS